MDLGSVCWASGELQCENLTRPCCKTWNGLYCKIWTGPDRLDGLVFLDSVSEYWPFSLSLQGVLGPHVKPKSACRLRNCYKALTIMMIIIFIQRLKALGLNTVLNMFNKETVYEQLRRWWALPGLYTEARWTAWCCWSLSGCTGYKARASLITLGLTTKQPELDILGARWMTWHLWSWTGCAGQLAIAPVTYSNMTVKHGLDPIRQMIINLILNVNFGSNNY